MAAGGELYLPTATFEELCSVPGMGPALARRVVEFRQSGGPLARPDDLLLIPGVSPALLARLRPRLRFDSPSPPVLEPPCDTVEVACSPAVTDPPPVVPESEAAGPTSLGGTDEGESPSPLERGDQPLGADEWPRHEVRPSQVQIGPLELEQAEPEPQAAVEPAILEIAPEPCIVPQEPSKEASASPRPAFNEDENWPRSYGGVNPAVIFGEGDRAVVDPAEGRRGAGIALSRVQLALLLALVALVGAALSVAAIYALNRTLYFVPSQDWQRSVVQPLATVQTESAALAERAADLEGAIAALQARADAAALDVTALEGGRASAEERIEALEQGKADVEALAAEVATLREEMATMQGRVDRFGDFLQSVSAALQNVLP